MSFSKRRILVSVAALSAVVLAGCSPTQDGDPSPPPPPQTFKAEFNPSTLRLPWPNDAFFAGTTDGTLNLPAEAAQYFVTTLRTELNTLDGFSTTAPMNTLFDAAIDGSTLSGSSVHVIEMYLGSIPPGLPVPPTFGMPAGPDERPAGTPSPVIRKLVYGTDFTAEVSPDYDSYGKILRITPLKPLRPSTGITNGLTHIGYYVLLTNGIKDTRGQIALPDDFYAALKAAPANCSSFTDVTSLTLCGWTKAHLAIGQAVGVNPDSVVVSWGFTTQSVEDTFNMLAATVPAQQIGVVATGLSTAAVGGFGKANIYAGTTQVPYYLAVPVDNHDSAAVLTSYWHAAGPSPVPGIDPASRNVTKYNPMPGATSTVTIPLLVTVPNATANGGLGCTKPPAGYPVAIVQHGITRNRSDALGLADAFADACFIVASIDLPLHGITDTANPLYDAAHERTFNVDLVNNVTGAAGPDGLIDSSGTHMINLVSPLTSRDNLRQGEADLIAFTKSVANLDIDGGGSDIDPTRIHFVGHSLGAVVGGTHVHYTATRTATLANPGGSVVRLLLDSPTFGPRIRAGLASAGITNNSTIFNNRLLRDFQTVVDGGDPINHICACSAQQPVLLFQVQGDVVVPNNSTQRLVAAGNLRQLSAAGPHPVGPTEGVWVDFTQGDHSSLLSPAASFATTVEMQTQTVTFAASAVAPGGPFVVITDTSVIGQP
jgi:pimeloyl-ACP methyl ester carboxylesterase